MLIGRDGELQAVARAWRHAQRGVLVTGPPGIGRTAFAGGVASMLRAGGADVMQVRGTTTARAVKLWPLASQLLDVAPGQADLDGAVRAALAARAGDRFVVVIDDGHLLDDASAVVLAELLDGPLGFVAVTADERAVTGPLLSHPALEPLELQPLDVAAVTRFLLANDVHDVDPATAHERTDGNPTALLRLLVVADGHRVLATGARRDPIDVVLGRLSAPARRLLDVIAVAEPLPDDAVAAALGVADALADATVDELVRSGLVTSSETGLGGSELRFVHASDAAVVAALMAPLRTRSVVRLAVRAATAAPGRRTPEALVRLAALATRVGEQLDVDDLRAATAAARTGDDGDVALRLARAAATATGAFDDVRVWADLAYERGALDDLDMALLRMRGLVDADTDVDERSRRATSLAVATSERALWRHADPAGALRALDEADRTVRGARRDELTALRARLLATVGSTLGALELAEPLLGHGDARVRAQAAAAVCHARRRRGAPTGGIAALDAVLATPGADDDVLLVSRQVLGSARALALAEAGRWEEAEQTARAARAVADRSDDRAGRAVASLVLAVALCGRGRPTTALTTARRALQLFETLTQPAGVRWALATIAFAAGLGGDAAVALTAVDRLRGLAHHPATLLPAMEPLGRAWASVHGSPDDARAILRDAAAELAASGDIGAAVACLHELAVLGGADEALAALTALGATDDEPLSLLRLDHVAALAVDDHGRLGHLAGTYAALGGDRLAVECAAAASGCAARLGDRRAAAQWAAEAVRLADACEGLATPALANARLVRSGAIPLTDRERDVALLAARGLPSREIAERLALSVRTVDNHLARCFDKLGVRSRGELGPLLGVDP